MWIHASRAGGLPDAEIIAVGSELLTPQRVDTNSLFLTEKLNALGVEVVRKSVVGDDRERLKQSLLEALAASSIVILTGGLGPTEDDVTRDAVAAALGRTLVFNQAICDEIEARFRSFNRKMAEINKRQAYLVDGAERLNNTRGTAPGQWIDHDGAWIVLLPGPPHELKPLFERECIPRLLARLPAQVIRSRHFRVAGIGESDLDQLIAPVYTRYTNPVTTILAHAGDIQIHLRARCAVVEEAESLLAEVSGPIETLLAERIYSRSGDSLEVTIGGMLRARGEALCVAESCTGGMLAERITAIPGSSDYFIGGFLTYSDAMKISLLGVPATLIEQHTAVSEPVACAMALGAKQRTGADYVLAVTGYAGPDGGTQANPVGVVFVGLAHPDGCDVRRFQFPGDRPLVRAYATQTSLDLLRRKLQQSGAA